MKTLTLAKVKENIDNIFVNTLSKNEPLIIKNKDGNSVVMLSYNQYQSWQNLLYNNFVEAKSNKKKYSINELIELLPDDFNISDLNMDLLSKDDSIFLQSIIDMANDKAREEDANAWVETVLSIDDSFTENSRC